MNKTTAIAARFGLAVAAAAFLCASIRLPLWHMRMEAPQYQGSEALKVRVRPGSLEGSLDEIKVLNHYIGVTIPDTLPQTRWLPATLALAAGLGLAIAFLPGRLRRFGAWTLAGLLSGAILFAAAQAQWQMYRIGHNRNHHHALRGVGDFTPPLLGSHKVAQFTLSSGLGAGSGCIAAALGLYAAAGLLAGKPSRTALKSARSAPKPAVREEAPEPCACRTAALSARALLPAASRRASPDFLAACK